MHNKLDQSDPRTRVFNTLYDELAGAWEHHQEMRMAPATPIFTLGESSIRLHAARDAMWQWWKENKLERN